MKSLLLLSLMLAPLSVWAAPIAVRVVDEAGAPIAGATVQVQRYDQVAPLYAIATTDAQGAANYDLGASKFNPDFFGRAIAWKAGNALAGANLLKLQDGTLTLTLRAGASVGGKIENAKGPVEGALVQLESARADKSYLSLGANSPLAQTLVARSDAAGRFTLEGVPASAKLTLRITGEGYATQSVEATGGGEVGVKLRPGATLRGRVIGTDGAPLAGTRVLAELRNDQNNALPEETETDAEGNYTLGGLQSGTYNLLFAVAPDAAYAIGARQSIIAAAGETRELEPARAVEGITVRGRVINAASKAGIADISVGVFGPTQPTSSGAIQGFATDKDGNFSARVVPGDNNFYILNAPQIWENSEQKVALDLRADATVAPLIFELTPATALRGRIVDADGKGVKTQLSVKQQYREWPLQSDENGDFNTYPDIKGKVTIGRSTFADYRQKDEAAAQPPWEITREQTLNLPSTEPIRIVVQRAKVGVLSGIVADENGKPIEGARLDLTLTTGEGVDSRGEFEQVTSDAQGRLTLPNVRTDQTVTVRGLEKTGYDLQGDLKISRNGNDWTLRPIRLRTRQNQLAGRVTLADGTPAAGAQVFAAGSETRADAQGNYVLKVLPAGDANVFAYANGQFGFRNAQTSVADGVAGGGKAAPLELKLAPQSLQPTDRELAREMIERAKVLAVNSNYYAMGELKLHDANGTAALEAATAAPKRNGEQLVKVIYTNMGNSDAPTPLLLRATRAVEEPRWRLYAATMLFAKRADWPDDDATRDLVTTLGRDANAIVAATDAPNKWISAIGLVGVAPIAERFEGEAAGEAAFESAVKWIEKEFPATSQGDTPSREATLAVMADLVAANSPRLYARLISRIRPQASEYGRALQEGAIALAKGSGLEVAAPYLRKLGEAPSPEPDEDGGVRSMEPLARQATRQAIEAGGASAPALALELARGMVAGDNGLENEGARALAEAAFFQSPDVAASLWKEALPELGADRAAQIAVRVMQTQPALGRELLDQASQKLDSAEQGIDSWGNSTVASFAFTEARTDAARARYRLEKAWWEAQGKTDDFQIMPDLVRAMAAIDGERAFEWASLLSASDDQRDARIDALSKAARYIEADDRSRAKVDFERWARDSTVFVD